MNREVIGEALKNARVSRGLSQSEIARRMTSRGHTQFHQTTVARIEKASRGVDVEEAVALFGLLGLDLAELLGRGTQTDATHEAFEAGRKFERERIRSFIDGSKA